MYRIQSFGIVAAVAGILATPLAGASSSTHAADSGSQAAEWRQPAPMDGLALKGTGSLSWFGLKVYDAALWSETAGVGHGSFRQRLALRIDYHRPIKAGRLVQATRKEWRNLDDHLDIADPPRIEAWLAQAGSIWPDVEPGDFILTIVEPGGKTTFYGPDGLLGVVDDPDFGPAFLAIWLHPRTSRPELRSALLGDPDSGA